MAISFVNFSTGDTSPANAGNITVTASGTGNLLVAFMAVNGFTPGPVVTSLSDNVGNVYVQGPGVFISGTGPFDDSSFDIWYCPNSVAGGTTLTYATTAPPLEGTVRIGLTEFSGALLSSPFVSGANIPNTVGSPTGPSFTPALSGELLIAVGIPATINLTSASSPFSSNSLSAGGIQMAYCINPPLAPIAAAFVPSTAQAYVSVGALFKPPAPSSGAATFLVF